MIVSQLARICQNCAGCDAKLLIIRAAQLVRGLQELVRKACYYKKGNSMLSISQHKGFQLKFDNGWTVSVQFGPGNYCERNSTEYNAPKLTDKWDSATAEVAAWNADGVWFDFGCDKVQGHLTADEVAAFIAKVRAF